LPKPTLLKVATYKKRKKGLLSFFFCLCFLAKPSKNKNKTKPKATGTWIC